MARMTAVELGADTCALARANVRRGDVELVAAETLDPAAFPSIDAFTATVRQARKALKLPRRCRAVVWGLPDGTTRRDPAVKPLIAPLVGAGFRVERVISPCNALAALARLRMPRGDGATCWLAINRTGVAMVVVRPGKQLYAHSFAWDSNVGSSGSQARLLQRYSLVAFLAPEIRRAMNTAREKGTPVDAIVTCGNLPEIRSLTMPLIEELDVEVESLDSLDGLVVKPEAAERLSDVAASLRIACAGAIARPTRRRDESKRAASAVRSVARVAAAAAVIGAVGFIGWSWWHAPSAAPPARPAVSAKAAPTQIPAPKQTVPPTQTAPSKQTVAPTQTASPPQTAPAKQESVAKPPARVEPPSSARPAPPVLAQKPAPQIPAPVVSDARRPAESKPAAKPQPPATATRQPLATATRPQPPKPVDAAPSVSEAAKRAAANVPPLVPPPSTQTPPKAQAGLNARGKPLAPEAVRDMREKDDASVKQPLPVQRRPTVRATPQTGPSALNTLPRPADKTDAASVPAPGNSGRMPELLKDPLPRVTAILVSSDRRMATIDEGRIVSVGDALGKRVVVAIDERAVVLKEPSGVQIRVGLGGRVLGVERSQR